MSRFFNETRKALQQERNGANRSNGSGTFSVDLQEAINELKSGIDKEIHPAAPPNPSQVIPILSALGRTDEVSAQLAAVRLEQCRRIRLPRGDEKLFSTAQYNRSMQVAVEGYRTLRTRLVKRQTENGTRSLVISSATQGEGKSLTSMNLALCYANIQNWPILLVDADLRTRGLSRLMGDPDSPGLAQILENGCSYDSAILATDIPNLYVLPAGESACPPPELFSSTRWKEFIGWCNEAVRLVIIDTPPVLDLTDFELITAVCESVLVIVRARTTNKESLTRLRNQLDFNKVVGVVVNSAEPDRRGNSYYYGYGNAPLKP
ncbi:MAG TPA: CpsD/CapB family tyrosine-protein kinase [Verrucomicrobiae bacterium]|nr:CpsD/CapB family tyrosine-protein kinase [Verrucomicrobiae bacterium]